MVHISDCQTGPKENPCCTRDGERSRACVYSCTTEALATKSAEISFPCVSCMVLETGELPVSVASNNTISRDVRRWNKIYLFSLRPIYVVCDELKWSRVARIPRMVLGVTVYEAYEALRGMSRRFPSRCFFKEKYKYKHRKKNQGRGKSIHVNINSTSCCCLRTINSRLSGSVRWCRNAFRSGMTDPAKSARGCPGTIKRGHIWSSITYHMSHGGPQPLN